MSSFNIEVLKKEMEKSTLQQALGADYIIGTAIKDHPEDHVMLKEIKYAWWDLLREKYGPAAAKPAAPEPKQKRAPKPKPEPEPEVKAKEKKPKAPAAEKEKKSQKSIADYTKKRAKPKKA